MHTKSLLHLYARYDKQSRSLTSLFVTKLPVELEERNMCDPVHQNGRAYLVIRLQQLWAAFCRELVVRSAIGGYETRTGQALSRVPDVRYIGDIAKVTKKPVSGPGSSWEEPKFTIRQAKALSLTNRNEIELGIGAVSTNLANLKCVRNFIVHPNDITGNKYLQMTRSIGFVGLAPDELLHQFLPGGVTVFDFWVSDLLCAAWNAVA